MKIFSGIQPTNQLHIGNYLGAIKQWLSLQKDNECLFCIVDLHALTVPYEPSSLKKKVLQVALAYVASGINPQKSIIFTQSHVKEHSELNWLLSTITPLGDLERMTQFKDKSKKHKTNINAGLLNYPVLMASDILLYQTELVPVGQDQKQHVELARNLAQKFNNRFGETFRVPKSYIPKLGAKIMSLKEPLKKMSKSDSKDTFISLFDSPQEIKKKIMTAKTDSGKEIKYEPKRKPGLSNLLTIYSLFSEQPIKKIESKFKNKGYKELKESLTELLTKELKPFREKREKELEKVLKNGAKRAEKIAKQTMRKVKKNMGLT